MLQLPAILISVLLATIYALSYALVIGKTGPRLWWYWAFGLTGFFAGFVIAGHGHWTTWGLGQVPVLESSVSSAAMLILATALRR